MNDAHVFSRVFLSGGSPVVLDELEVTVCDRLGRPGAVLTLAAGDIAFDPVETRYSFTIDLAWLPAGDAVVEWRGMEGGSPVGEFPFTELRPRPQRHARFLGATVEDVLERLRGLDMASFDPVYTGAPRTGEAVLERCLSVAEGRVLSELPEPIWRLLTSRFELVSASAPAGATAFTLHSEGGRLISCSVRTCDGGEALAPNQYTISGRTLTFALPLAGGEKVTVEVGYADFAPEMLRGVVVTLAAVPAAVSLGNPSVDRKSVV